MYTKENREYKLWTEQRAFRITFFFYTDDGEDRLVSPEYRADIDDKDEAIKLAWEAFRDNATLDSKTVVVKPNDLNSVIPQGEVDTQIDEEWNKQLEELSKLPSTLYFNLGD